MDGPSFFYSNVKHIKCDRLLHFRLYTRISEYKNYSYSPTENEPIVIRIQCPHITFLIHISLLYTYDPCSFKRQVRRVVW